MTTTHEQSPAEAHASAGGGGRDLAQLGVCAFLAVLGVGVLVDASMMGHAITQTDPLGPKTLPIVLGSALVVLSVALTVAVIRGSRPQLEEGEDVDLGAPVDLRTVAGLLGVFIANALLVDILGWVISGGLLFYGASIILGSRQFVRALVVAFALSLATFYGFAIGLGVALPAGILQGIL